MIVKYSILFYTHCDTIFFLPYCISGIQNIKDLLLLQQQQPLLFNPPMSLPSHYPSAAATVGNLGGGGASGGVGGGGAHSYLSTPSSSMLSHPPHPPPTEDVTEDSPLGVELRCRAFVANPRASITWSGFRPEVAKVVNQTKLILKPSWRDNGAKVG